MKRMKKMLCVLLALVIALSVTTGMTAFAADNTLSAGETITVTVSAEDFSEEAVKFTAEETGAYRIQSLGSYDTAARIVYEDGGEDDYVFVGSNDDAADEDDNFCLNVILEAGKTYTLLIETYEEEEVSFDVTAAFLYKVTDIDFTPAEDYVYLDGTSVYPNEFNDGDKLNVTTDSGVMSFVYDFDGFYDKNGKSIEFYFSTVPSLEPVTDFDETTYEDIFLNQVEFTFFHYSKVIDVAVEEVPVKSITYKPAGPIVVVKNVSGNWDFDAKGKKYFYYFADIPNEGDVLTIKYKDGTSEKFTAVMEQIDIEDLDEEYLEFLIMLYGDDYEAILEEETTFFAYVNADGEYLDDRYLNFYDNQEEFHWTLGKDNYMYAEFMNAEYKLPVEVIEAGWYKSGGKWYYYDNIDGVKATGWQKINKKWYYFDKKGVMQTGWKKISGKWYYFDKSGAMLTGWQKINKKWYYFNYSGAMLTGWQKINKKWYYFDKSGAMLSGWQKIGKTWYYFQSNGAMKTGWLKSGGKWYYFKSNGAMAIGRVIIGKKTYRFNSSGVCQNP